MNRDKLDRYMLTRPRNICPKTALNPSAITQFAKEKPANFMEAVLSLTTWILLVT